MKKYIKYLVLLIIAGAAYGFYMYNKPHQDLARAKADFQLESAELFSAYELNEEKSNELYLGKIIEVQGLIKSITEEEGVVSITIEAGSEIFGIICGMEANAYEKIKDPIKEGQKVTIRGICTGMLMDVVLERCVVI